VGGGAGREENDQTKERGRMMRRRKRVFEREKNKGNQRGGG